MRPQLISGRLELSLFDDNDVAALHSILSDPLTNTIGDGPFTSLTETEQWITKRRTAFERHGLAWYAVRQRVDRTLIGNCGLLVGRARPSEPEIGYLISRAYQGHGYATEATCAVLDECADAGITRVWASIRPANVASRHIIEHAGFTFDRTEDDSKGTLLYYKISFPSSFSPKK